MTDTFKPCSNVSKQNVTNEELTPLDPLDKILIPFRKGGVRAPSFLI
jgi:hypothetical protein